MRKGATVRERRLRGGWSSVSWLALAGCGAAAPPAEEPRAEVVVPNENAPAAEAEPAAPPPSPPTERAVLVDGVRGAVVFDEFDGFRLVGGAGTLALVGPDGHVRASHRFAFGADGATGVFLDAGRVVTGNGDHDGFRGPWSGRLSRWSLDTDTIEQLRALGYAAPSLARLDGVVVVVSPTESMLSGVTVTSLDEYGDYGVDSLGWAPGRPPECYVGSGEQTWLVRADGGGHLVLTDVNGPVPETPSPTPAAGLSMSTQIGARGMPAAELAPTARILAISTSSTMVLLGPDGIGSELPSPGYVQWSSDATLRVGSFLHPLSAPTIHRTSMLVDRVPSPMYSESDPIPELSAFGEWQYQAREAQESGAPVPPLTLQPVCSSGAPVRCVRVHVDDEQDIDGWELFDPARPTRVLARLEGRQWPPGYGYVVVAPGGRFLRDIDEGATITPLPRGEPINDLETWVELETGWVYVEPADMAVVHFLPYRGRAVERTFGGEVRSLTIVDGAHVLVGVEDDAGDVGHVVELPSLSSVQTIDIGSSGSVARLHCHDADLVDEADDVVVEGGCPVPGLDFDDSFAITSTRDRAFWLDARLGDEIVVHRGSDGAVLRVRVTTGGVLVSGPGGMFEATGDVRDHVVVREPGPVRAATITAGGEARARFERPGLTAAFFRGDPLPTP